MKGKLKQRLHQSPSSNVAALRTLEIYLVNAGINICHDSLIDAIELFLVGESSKKAMTQLVRLCWHKEGTEVNLSNSGKNLITTCYVVTTSSSILSGNCTASLNLREHCHMYFIISAHRNNEVHDTFPTVLLTKHLYVIFLDAHERMFHLNIAFDQSFINRSSFRLLMPFAFNEVTQ